MLSLELEKEPRVLSGIKLALSELAEEPRILFRFK